MVLQNLLQNIEKKLNIFFEEIFKKGTRPIQPVEIARYLAREMDLQKRVSVSRIYAPNVYHVSLGKNDFEKFEPLQKPFARELEEYVKNKAIEKGYTLIGSPTISFFEDSSLKEGEIQIKSAFSSCVDLIDGTKGCSKSVDIGDQQSTRSTITVENYSPIEHTMIFNAENKEKENEEKRSTRILNLSVIEGPDYGKSAYINEGETCTIGRRSTNRVILNDLNVSREHAMIEWRDGVPYIIDLQSKNGTFVNGVRINKRRLEAEDQIRIGENLLRVERG